MPRFLRKNLPPHWRFVPSRRQVRDLLNRLPADVRLVEFGGTSRPSSTGRISLGFVESRVEADGWCFYLQLWGTPEATVGPMRGELSEVALGEIERYIRTCLATPPGATIKPAQLSLAFQIEEDGIKPACRSKIKDRYFFASGDWWR